MWRIPPSLLLLCPLLLSSSLLFFFNQAVWGCQVFWDEDSQPCEKLIPCGPSSPWRSSPWEHWWWLAGRWRWAEGGMDRGMKAAMNTGPPTPKDWVAQTPSNSLPNLNTWTRRPGMPLSRWPPAKNYHTDSAQTKISSSPVPFITHTNLCQAPSPRPFDGAPCLTDRQRGWNGEQRGFEAWRARRVASEGWQWLTMERVLLLHCAPKPP